MEQFLTDDDLLGLLEELDQEDAEIEELEFEMEMEASNRRYERQRLKTDGCAELKQRILELLYLRESHLQHHQLEKIAGVHRSRQLTGRESGMHLDLHRFPCRAHRDLEQTCIAKSGM